jgi:hypothetical protein
MWEARHARKGNNIPNYKDYSQLAQKSFGHMLGPIAMLYALGYNISSPEVRHTIAFFKHYLIARQLNDDAHDWEDDLKRGQVNAVAAALLLQVPQNQHTNQEVLRTIFWQKTMVYVSKDIYSHIKKARQSIAKVSIISKTDFFEHMLRAEENSAKRAIDERKETIAFIKTYKAY